MKKLFAVPLAVLFVAACSDSTSPASSTDLNPSYAKPTTPTVVCASCPVAGEWDFENGTTISAVGGGTIATELQPGNTGSASDPNVVEAPFGQNFLGRFANTRTMVVINSTGGANYNLTFDLYIIGSWDGRGKQAQQGVFKANVVDIGYRCSPSGAITSLFKTTFSNQYTVQQDYPNAYLSGGFKAGSGAEGIDELGYRTTPLISNTPEFRSFGDAIYNMTFSGANQCGGAAMTFIVSSSNPDQQSVYDESWGVDNVVVRSGT
jgi:hypothetical protein